MLNKTDLRRSLLAVRQAMTPEQRANYDAAIAAQLRLWLKANPLRILGVYWPIRSEPDLRTLYADLSREGMQLALPVVVGKDAPLAFAAWTPGDPLERDAHGVPTPVKRDFVSPEGLLIPCVGINADNNRLGYGGGFYDRTLATKPGPLAIGIAYACSRAAFSADPHDVALDMVITD
jgi:5-formyltetrahydrofolate cyclo-ligase